MAKVSLIIVVKVILDPLKLNSEQYGQLQKVAEVYVHSDDKSIGNTAREVIKICKANNS